MSVLLFTPAVAAASDPGDLDPSFGMGGNVIVDLGGREFAYAVAADSLDRVVVAGQAVDGSTFKSSAVVLRLRPDGSLDPSFGSGGIAEVDVGSSDFAYSMAITANDEIVVGGQTSNNPHGSGADYLIFRLDESGVLDGSFGTNGVFAADFGRSEYILDLAIQPDGKIVAGGGTDVLRLTTDGSLDPTFGVGGVANIGANANSLAVRPNGKIVVGSGPHQSYAAVQLEADGTIDLQFGTSGTGSVSFGVPTSFRDLALQPDGKVVLSGSVNLTPFNIDFGLVRLNVDGSPDASFGTGGAVLTNIGVGDFADGVAIQADGKIVAAGTVATAFTGRSDIGVARYMPDGSLDTSFGVGGVTLTDFGKLEFPWKTAIQGDGKILVAGTSTSSVSRTDANFQVVRYLASSDTTPPVVIGVTDRAPNVHGWYNAPVDIDWIATDDSGSATDPANTVAAVEGEAVSYTSDLSCDPSGNCASGSVALSIDATPPTIDSAGLADGSVLVSTTTTLTIAGSDDLSGIIGGEYFLGADPGVGQAIPLAEMNGVLSAVVGDQVPAGIFSVGVRVQDRAGNWSDTRSLELVVFDPDAGSVTGGGWFDSVAGASTADPDAAGNANFGFTSKYTSGDLVPSGQLQFGFTAGGINYHASSIDWMVVTGDTAVWQTVGTLNGEGTYTCRIWVEDGTDRIRVAISVGDASGTVTSVYDTGALLDLGGGSIKIHG